ncbi:MAG TPA: peptidylprolyl isomerase [Cyclobacteriaceae bacterium]|jgi:cyclophilin family peptidyl-prolyl cis-trans isomerase/HEAT repeat protein|nr:peptidylprolyl isomerase [Cyclobacteriaceae bacterium]
MRYASWILLLTVWVGCTPPNNKFHDERIREIYDLKDRRSTDTLLVLLGDISAQIRNEAAMALASVQDSLASNRLGTALLEDPDEAVRVNAAFALGQTGGYQAVNALLPALTTSPPHVTREVLEALGKSVSKSDLGILLSFEAKDTLLQEGLAWAFYRLTLRKMADSTVTARMAEYLLPAYSYQTRLAAAHYFSRTQQLQGKGYEENLIAAAKGDTRSEVRMAAINGFRSLAPERSVEILRWIFKASADPRIRISAVRVCQNYPLKDCFPLVYDGLVDSVELVAVAASEVIIQRMDASLYDNLRDAPIKTSFRTKANLLAAFLATSSDQMIWQKAEVQYQQSAGYEKAAIANAIGKSGKPFYRKAFELLSREAMNTKELPVVQTAVASALTQLNRNAHAEIPNREFASIYQQLITGGDLAAAGIAASALSDPALDFRKDISDVSFLEKARQRFTLPKDLEMLQPIEIALAYLAGKEKPTPIKNTYNHPIDWKLIGSIQQDQQMEIKTSRGTIVVVLYVEESPGAVSNFVALADQHYFDKRFVHRVVPNFVVQTGCNRGDGYGSEDYSIRSEFSRRRYTTGSLGMASAGKDTEGTQWFIAHSPTPHLDGGYTIFGEVVSGQEVADKLQVGDIIESITRVNK